MNENKNTRVLSHKINHQSEILTDLPVADEQADQTKGGVGAHVKVFDGARTCDSVAEIDGIIIAGSGATSAHVK